MEAKLKHLDFIQGVVNRLSTNSFLLKGWSVVLVSGLFILSGEESEESFAYLALIPSVVIWGLDGYFLWQERLFRRLYELVRLKKVDEIDFSMSTAAVSDRRPSYISSVFSMTLIVFHATVVGSIFVVTVLL